MGLAAGIGFTAFGTLAEANAQEQAGEGNAAILRRNAALAEISAVDALERGKEDARLHRSKVRQIIGSQRARLAAQGIDIESGSALDVQVSTATVGEYDAITIENNAAREAWGYRNQVSDFQLRADIAEQTGRADRTGTLLTGAGDVFFMDRGGRLAAPRGPGEP